MTTQTEPALFESPPQSPQSIGDSIGRSFRLFRNSVPMFLKAQLLPTVILTTGHILVQAAATFGLKKGDSIQSLVFGIAGLGLGMVITMIGVWLLTLRQLAFVRLANGLSATFSEAMQFANSKKWTLIGLFLIAYAVGSVIFVAWAIELIISLVLVKTLPMVSIAGSILGVIGLLWSIAVLSVYYLMTVAALGCEQRSWTEVVGGTFNLIKRDLGRSVGFGTLLVIILWVFSWTLSLPIVALSIFELMRKGLTNPAHFDPSTALPFYCLVLSQLWQSTINMLLMPVTFISTGLFYQDMKIRQEGFDVIQSLHRLEKAGT